MSSRTSSALRKLLEGVVLALHRGEFGKATARWVVDVVRLVLRSWRRVSAGEESWSEIAFYCEAEATKSHIERE